MSNMPTLPQRLLRAVDAVCDALFAAVPTAVLVTATAAVATTNPIAGSSSWGMYGSKRHLPGALDRGLT
jgi:hypothetical protein